MYRGYEAGVAPRREKGLGLAGKPEAFRKAGRRSRCQNLHEPLIWTAHPFPGP